MDRKPLDECFGDDALIDQARIQTRPPFGRPLLHSCRSALIGSTVAARLAGTQLDARAMRINGLSFDLQMYDHQAAEAVALAKRFPETTIIIEHLARALDLSSVGFDQWRQHLQALSQCSNVFLKLSGIGCVFRDSDPGWIRQWLQQAVSCFGPKRCMFGSNCPPDTIFYDFKTLLRMYMAAFADYSPDEQETIFYGTAQRIYRL